MDHIALFIYYIAMLWDVSTIKVNAISTGYCTPDWHWVNPPGREENYYVLWLVRGGEAKLSVKGQNYCLQPDDCYVLNLGWEIEGRHNPENPLIVPWCTFETFDAAGDPCQLPLQRHRHLHNISFVLNLFDRTAEAFNQYRPDAAGAGHWLQSLLMEIGLQDKCTARFQKKSRASRIDALCETIYKHPAHQYSVNQLARQLHCSKDHFIRIFKQHTGITPIEFVIRARIKTAQDLLQFSSHSVSEVADQLGYSTVYFFIRQFKKITGVPPLQWRKKRTATTAFPSSLSGS